MTQPVFDLFFGDDPGALGTDPARMHYAEHKRHARPDAQPAGWVGGQAPNIPREAWPRSPVTGFPMVHLLTLELPAAYRRRGEELPGIALFQADDHTATATPGAAEALRGEQVADAAFFKDLAKAGAAAHPEAVVLKDLIGGHFCLIWLRAEELAGRVAPPEDLRGTASLPDAGQNLNAWDHAQPEIALWLGERPFDPNAGKVPEDVYADEDDESTSYEPSDEYIDVTLSNVPELKAFFEEVHGRSHLGGTCLGMQGVPELTPFFLELEDGVGGANFGGGNLQLDLENGTIDWAC